MFANFGPIWLGNWYDATPFLAWYSFGYHTGADLNLTTNPAADKDAPIFAVADGKVIFAGDADSWGNIIVIEHPDALVTLPNGQTQRQRVFSRYGHVSNNIKVSRHQSVTRGQNIGFIGLARGVTSGWHLHFDISYSDMLRSRPAHWPNQDEIKALRAAGKENTRDYFNAQLKIKKVVITHYVDPYKFLKDNR
jgi:murein DD-endopeptidase MepM/ murein hydrolase activator NlpD